MKRSRFAQGHAVKERIRYRDLQKVLSRLNKFRHVGLIRTQKQGGGEFTIDLNLSDISHVTEVKDEQSERPSRFP